MSRKNTRRQKSDELALARIIEDVVDRKRAGEVPSVKDYAEEHPHLASVIGRRLALIELLESARAAGQLHAPDETTGEMGLAECDLATAIAELPERGQRLVYLRQLERMRWPEIAAQLGGNVEALRREHAAVLRGLLERCRDWLTQSGSS